MVLQELRTRQIKNQREKNIDKNIISKGSSSDKSTIKEIGQDTIYTVKNSEGTDVYIIIRSHFLKHLKHLLSISEKKISSLEGEDKKYYSAMINHIKNISLSEKISEVLFKEFEQFREKKNLDPESVGFFFSSCKLKDGIIYCDVSSNKNEIIKKLDSTILIYNNKTKDFIYKVNKGTKDVYVILNPLFTEFTKENLNFLKTNFTNINIVNVDQNGNVISIKNSSSSSNSNLMLIIFIILVLIILFLIFIYIFKKNNKNG